MLPLIGIPLDLDLPDTPETAKLEPEFRRHAVEQAATAFLDRALPVRALMVMEDVHHMDEASQGLLAAHHRTGRHAGRYWSASPGARLALASSPIRPPT